MHQAQSFITFHPQYPTFTEDTLLKFRKEVVYITTDDKENEDFREDYILWEGPEIQAFQYVQEIGCKRLDLCMLVFAGQGFSEGQAFFPPFVTPNFLLYKFYTVESLCRVYWPQLEELSLSENRIINLSSLRKMDTMKLCQIEYSQNYVLECRDFFMLPQSVNHLYMEDQLAKGQVQQINWALKLESPLKFLSIQSQERIRMKQNVREKLVQKNQGIKLHESY